MALTWDASSASASFSNVSLISWNHTTGTADTAIAHASRVTTFTEKVMTAAWGTTSGAGGTAMHEISGGHATNNDGTFFTKASLFFVTASDLSITGTQEVTLTFTSGAAYGGTGASTWVGAHQTTPLINRVTQIDSSANPTVTVTSATGDSVVSAISWNGGPSFVTVGNTSVYKVGTASQTGAGNRDNGAATVVLSYTAIAVLHALIGADIQLPAAAGGTVSPRKALLGVGQ